MSAARRVAASNSARPSTSSGRNRGGVLVTQVVVVVSEISATN
jgi:hypothetical protein